MGLDALCKRDARGFAVIFQQRHNVCRKHDRFPIPRVSGFLLFQIVPHGAGNPLIEAFTFPFRGLGSGIEQIIWNGSIELCAGAGADVLGGGGGFCGLGGFDDRGHVVGSLNGIVGNNPFQKHESTSF